MQRFLLASILTASLLSALIAHSEPRQVSQKLIKLGLEEGTSICDRASYCYKFDAIVDIDSGYLRVWAIDEEGTKFLFKKLYKGDAVKVRQTYKYKGVWYAQLSGMREGCARESCAAFVELQYLR